MSYSIFNVLTTLLVSIRLQASGQTTVQKPCLMLVNQTQTTTPLLKNKRVTALQFL